MTWLSAAISRAGHFASTSGSGIVRGLEIGAATAIAGPFGGAAVAAITAPRPTSGNEVTPARSQTASAVEASNAAGESAKTTAPAMVTSPGDGLVTQRHALIAGGVLLVIVIIGLAFALTRRRG